MRPPLYDQIWPAKCGLESNEHQPKQFKKNYNLDYWTTAEADFSNDFISKANFQNLNGDQLDGRWILIQEKWRELALFSILRPKISLLL